MILYFYITLLQNGRSKIEKKSKRIKVTAPIPEGWQLGRKFKWYSFKPCPQCGTDIDERRKFCSISCSSKSQGSKFKDLLDYICAEYIKIRSIKRSLLNLGLSGCGGNAAKLAIELRKRKIIAE